MEQKTVIEPSRCQSNATTIRSLNSITSSTIEQQLNTMAKDENRPSVEEPETTTGGDSKPNGALESDAELLQGISKIRSSCVGDSSVLVSDPVLDQDALRLLRMVKALIVTNDEIVQRCELFRQGTNDPIYRKTAPIEVEINATGYQQCAQINVEILRLRY
jgi:hypothetical protein